MTLTHLQDTPANTVGDLPTLGTEAPDFNVIKLDLSELTLEDLAGKAILLDTFPSTDTGVYAASIRRFSIGTVAHPDMMVVNVPQDLPFTLGRSYGAEDIGHVITTSGFHSGFGTDYGMGLADFPAAGLLARAIVIIGANDTMKYTELVEDVAQSPSFEVALAPL